MKKLAIIIILFLCFQPNVFAQQDCPPTINDPGWISYVGIIFEPYPMDIWGSVDAKAREIGPGQYEIKIDWNTLNNLHRYGITDDELKQMMYKTVMTQIAKDNHLCDENTGTLLFVFYEETNCRVVRHCYLKVDKNKSVLCADDAWPGPDPSFFEYQNEKFYRLNTDIPCGTQCCQYNYIVECIKTATGEFKYLHILTQGKSPYPGSECNNNTFQDCLTGDPEPCQSTCY